MTKSSRVTLGIFYYCCCCEKGSIYSRFKTVKRKTIFDQIMIRLVFIMICGGDQKIKKSKKFSFDEQMFIQFKRKLEKVCFLICN